MILNNVDNYSALRNHIVQQENSAVREYLNFMTAELINLVDVMEDYYNCDADEVEIKLKNIEDFIYNFQFKYAVYFSEKSRNKLEF